MAFVESGERLVGQLARVAGRADAASRWLSVVDNLERALESASSTYRADPYGHEAVGVDYDADAETGTVVRVVRVVRPGYGAGERQPRPVGVVVAGQRG